MKDGPFVGQYTITHQDGEPIAPGRRLFVLDVDNDPYARRVLLSYADRVGLLHPQFARELIKQYDLIDWQPDEKIYSQGALIGWTQTDGEGRWRARDLKNVIYEVNNGSYVVSWLLGRYYQPEGTGETLFGGPPTGA